MGLQTRQEPPSALICLLSTHWSLTVELRTAHLFDSKHLPLFNYLALCPWLARSRMPESVEWVAGITLSVPLGKMQSKPWSIHTAGGRLTYQVVTGGFSQTSRPTSVLKPLYQQMVLVYSQCCTVSDGGFRDIWLIKRLPTRPHQSKLTQSRAAVGGLLFLKRDKMCMEKGLQTERERNFSPEGAHLSCNKPCSGPYEETGLIS